MAEQPVDLRVSVQAPTNPLNSQEKWYLERHWNATSFKRSKSINLGSQAFVQSDRSVAISDVLTPIHILPYNNDKENWLLSIDSPDTNHFSSLIYVENVPIYTICACKLYNVRGSTVRLERVPYDTRAIVHSTQIETGFIIGAYPVLETVVEIGDKLLQKCRRRSDMGRELLRDGVVTQSQIGHKELCDGNHRFDYHRNFCWICRGAAPNVRDDLRLCECKSNGQGNLVDLASDPGADEFSMDAARFQTIRSNI
jgi:hypothetical protein